MQEKIIRWLMYTILLSIAPIGASWIWSAANSHIAVGLSDIVRQGDLYLLSASFAAVGIGELIGKKSYEKTKLFLGGVSSLNIILSVFLYAALRNPTPTTNVEFLTSISYLLFAASCLVSTSCVALSEANDV